MSTQFQDLPYDIQGHIYRTMDDPDDRYAFRTSSKECYHNPFINGQIRHMTVSSYEELADALQSYITKPGAGSIKELVIQLKSYDDRENYARLAVFACMVTSRDLSSLSEHILQYLQEAGAKHSYEALVKPDNKLTNGRTLLERIVHDIHQPLFNLRSLVLKNCPPCFFFHEAIDFAYICPTIEKIVFDSYILHSPFEDEHEIRYTYDPALQEKYKTYIKDLSILENNGIEYIDDLDETIIDDSVINTISGITSLQKLVLHGCIDPHFHTAIARLSNLQTLDISDKFMSKEMLQSSVDYVLSNTSSLTSIAISQPIFRISSSRLQHLFIENLDAPFAHDLPSLQTFTFGHIDATEPNMLGSVKSVLDALPVRMSSHLEISTQDISVSEYVTFTAFHNEGFKDLRRLCTRIQTYSDTGFIEEIGKAFPGLEEWYIELGHDWILYLLVALSNNLRYFPGLRRVVVKCGKTNMRMFMDVSLEFTRSIYIDIYSRFPTFKSRSPNVFLTMHPLQDYKGLPRVQPFK